MSHWIDLLDPTEEEIRAHAPGDIEQRLVDLFTRPAEPTEGARPFLRGFGGYVAGIVSAVVLDPGHALLYYQEVDLIVTRGHIVTIRKTPAGGNPYDISTVQEISAAHKKHVAPGKVAYFLIEDVAERYLDLLDGLDGEVDELEENMTTWPSERIRRRLSELRHDLLHIRRTLSPTRDSVRAIADGRVDIDPGLLRREVFPDELEKAFGVVLDKLLRATESLDYTRDLLAAARDYHATEIATEQNDVIKRLTVIAGLVLVPTFIVGVYGQNFEHMPELRWHLGYLFSWGLIVLVTVAQLAFFRRKKWI